MSDIEELMDIIDNIEANLDELRKKIKATKVGDSTDIPQVTSWGLRPFSCKRCDGLRLDEENVFDPVSLKYKRRLICMDCGYIEEGIV